MCIPTECYVYTYVCARTVCIHTGPEFYFNVKKVRLEIIGISLKNSQIYFFQRIWCITWILYFSQKFRNSLLILETHIWSNWPFQKCKIEKDPFQILSKKTLKKNFDRKTLKMPTVNNTFNCAATACLVYAGTQHNILTLTQWKRVHIKIHIFNRVQTHNVWEVKCYLSLKKVFAQFILHFAFLLASRNTRNRIQVRFS